MADVFSMMMDALDTGVSMDVGVCADTNATINTDNNMQDRIAEVLALAAPKATPVATPMVVIATDPNDNNMLNADARSKFTDERVYYETYLFSSPINTTNTTSGHVSNVDFMEEELIQHVSPDENIVVYRCNYGKEVYVGYTEPVIIKKTNRGRKKKEKKKKPRKKQGNGTDFNSQMTFIVKSTMYETPDGVVPSDTPVYKIKVFRNGKIQLPGMSRDAVDDAVACTYLVQDELNRLLHDGREVSKITYLNPVMKNYRIRIKLDQLGLNGVAIVSLSMLKTLLTQYRERPHEEEPPHPAIFDIKYDEGETKLSIKFSTPIPNKPKKKTRVNLMTRGKINILGAFDAAVTFQICDYLHWMFEEHFDKLIIVEGGTARRECDLVEPHEDNISLCDYIPPAPVDFDISDILYELTCAEEAQAELANQYVNELFACA